ncbi:MAG: hypothetical protein C4524_01510 [Candidatus Zixiibacteriota bacterium]|nr:MAG: hypothetical protein C4524_01510 [candidate division Zixibacteria bacterium]
MDNNRELNPKAFAWGLGLAWAADIFIMTWWLILGRGRKNAWVNEEFFRNLYPGYRVTPLGSLAGLLWGLLDGLLAGWIIARIYNTYVRRTEKIHPNGW